MKRRGRIVERGLGVCVLVPKQRQQLVVVGRYRKPGAAKVILATVKRGRKATVAR